MFENLPETVLMYLSYYINEGFKNGVFPKCLKQAQVVPVYKGGEREDLTNYRPISLLSTLSKIIEKVVKKRIEGHITKNHILDRNQYGFQRARSTNDAMFAFLDSVYSAINGGDCVAAVFCDFSKAFDCVDHGILLRKLSKYGFVGRTYEWFYSYLTDRSQQVDWAGTPSTNRQVGISWSAPGFGAGTNFIFALHQRSHHGGCKWSFHLVCG